MNINEQVIDQTKKWINEVVIGCNNRISSKGNKSRNNNVTNKCNSKGSSSKNVMTRCNSNVTSKCNSKGSNSSNSAWSVSNNNLSHHMVKEIWNEGLTVKQACKDNSNSSQMVMLNEVMETERKMAEEAIINSGFSGLL